MCQNSTDSQKPLSGAWAKVQGHATAQLQLSNHSPVMCQLGLSVMRTSPGHEQQKRRRPPLRRPRRTRRAIRQRAMTFLRIITRAVSSQCDEFAPLHLPLEVSDVAGSGEDYHISSWRKGWIRMLVASTLMSPVGQTRRFDLLPVTSDLPLSTDIFRSARLVRFVPKREVAVSSQ